MIISMQLELSHWVKHAYRTESMAGIQATAEESTGLAWCNPECDTESRSAQPCKQYVGVDFHITH